MSRTCAFTGKKALVGNSVSHAHNKTKRRQQVNLKTKKVFDPASGRLVRLRVSAAGLRTLDKRGGL